MILGFKKVDKFVKAQQEMGNDVRWDGWSMVFHYPHEYAAQSPQGRFHNGTWGFETRVGPDDDGMWRVPQRNVRTVRRPRNRR